MAVAKYSTQNDPTAIQVVECDGLIFTAGAVLTAAQSDQLLKNTGASVNVTLTLPAAVVNLEYEVMNVATGVFLKLLAAGSDLIFWGNILPAGGTFMFANEKWAGFCLHCPLTGIWVVRGTPVGDCQIG